MRRQRIEQSVTYEHNGVRYSRLEDMPPHVRELFVDRDGNGIPDSIDQFLKEQGKNVQVSKTERNTVQTIGPRVITRLTARGDLDFAHAMSKTEHMDTLHCAKCGYDLKGTAVGANCPECGTPVTATIQQAANPSRTQYPLWLEVMMEFPAMAAAALGILILLGWFALQWIGVL